jgi:GntR family transcriptional regulator
MLKRKSPKPLYAQLEEIVREKIESGEWGPHDLIPSENELSRLYNMSRMTVRSVLTLLAREGLIYRVPGKGTFVAAPKITTGPLSYMGIREQLERMGYEISTKILRIDKIDSPQQIAKKLELRKGQPVYVLERVRYIKEEPISLHLSYIPLHMCEGLEHKDLEGEQLCVILDREYELRRGKVIETLESIKASPYEAKLFSVKSGHPLLLLEDVIYSFGEVPFEYSKVLFRGDKIKLRFEFDLRE